MPDYEIAYIGALKYIRAAPGTKVWIVMKKWPGGLQEQVAAYLTESLARAHVGHIAGKDEAAITLVSIPIQDRQGAA